MLADPPGTAAQPRLGRVSHPPQLPENCLPPRGEQVSGYATTRPLGWGHCTDYFRAGDSAALSVVAGNKRRTRLFPGEWPVILPESMPRADITSYKPTYQDLAFLSGVSMPARPPITLTSEEPIGTTILELLVSDVSTACSCRSSWALPLK